MLTEHTAAVDYEECNALAAYLVGWDIGGLDYVGGVEIGSSNNNYYHRNNFAGAASLPAAEQMEVVQKDPPFEARTGEHSSAFQRLGWGCCTMYAI